MVDNVEATADAQPATYNLLFVCTGNTCRSPMAMAIAKRALERRGWTHVAVDSAGIAAGPGRPASDGARRVAAERGLDLEAHRSQPLTAELLDWADLILGMTPSHAAAAREAGGGEKVALLTEFAAGDAGGPAVPDPFGGDEETYRLTFAELERAIGGVLARLEPILAP